MLSYTQFSQPTSYRIIQCPHTETVAISKSKDGRLPLQPRSPLARMKSKHSWSRRLSNLANRSSAPSPPPSRRWPLLHGMAFEAFSAPRVAPATATPVGEGAWGRDAASGMAAPLSLVAFSLRSGWRRIRRRERPAWEGIQWDSRRGQRRFLSGCRFLSPTSPLHLTSRPPHPAAT